MIRFLSIGYQSFTNMLLTEIKILSYLPLRNSVLMINYAFSSLFMSILVMILAFRPLPSTQS